MTRLLIFYATFWDSRRGHRHLFEAGRFAAAVVWEAMVSELTQINESTVAVRTSRAMDASELGVRDRALLDSVDDVSSAEELGFLLGYSLDDVVQSLQRLGELGLVTWSAPVAAASDEALLETVPVSLLADDVPTSDDAFERFAQELAPSQDLAATRDFEVRDLLSMMNKTTGAYPDLRETRNVASAPAPEPSPVQGLGLNESGLQALAREVSQEMESLAAMEAENERLRDPLVAARREISNPALSLTPSVPLEAIDAVRLTKDATRPLPPALPPRTSQDRIPTSNHPAISGGATPAAPLEPWKAAAGAPPAGGQRRTSSATPRRHLDTSWWSGGQTSSEPDEVLTAREVSVSGLLPGVAPPQRTTLTTTEVPIMSELAAAPRPTLSQRPQRLERPPGGFIGASRSKGPAQPPAAVATPDSNVEAPTDDAPDSQAPAWADEPIRASLKAGFGGWDEATARRISYHVRIVQTGTYYEVLGVNDDAPIGEILEAARRLRTSLDLGGLAGRATAEGAEALALIDKGVTRAIDVLGSDDSRASYDAALAALAAFRV